LSWFLAVGRLALEKNALKIGQRAGFELPRIPRLTAGGVPGGPALPEQVQCAALPLGGDMLKSDVVSGEFGDFTQGGFGRDLPEVLRDFIKYIHKNWDTLYLLLAGDVNVAPTDEWLAPELQQHRATLRRLFRPVLTVVDFPLGGC